MARTESDLISMSDIARITGQSRATVGNWKARESDFPLERGRSSRGPLYDRVEVGSWLEMKGKLARLQNESTFANFVGSPVGLMSIEDAVQTTLALIAVRSEVTLDKWYEIEYADYEDREAIIRSSTLFADTDLPQHEVPGEFLESAMDLVAEEMRDNAPVHPVALADELLLQAGCATDYRGLQFMISPPFRKLVVGISEPEGTVYCPTSGTGVLLIDASRASRSDSVTLKGQEGDDWAWTIGQMNLRIHDVKADVAHADVFVDDLEPSISADRVIALPPWGQRLPDEARLPGDPRWIWGEPGANDGNTAWIQHCLYHLADGGRAVIALPNSVQFETGRGGRIRQRIIKAGLLDAVFAMPSGFLNGSPLPFTLLVFSKSGSNAKGRPAPVLMVDLRNDEAEKSRRGRVLDDVVVDEAVGIYRRWKGGHRPDSEKAAVAQFDDLSANGFVIDPARYISMRSTVPDPDQLSRERAALIERLSVLRRSTDDADTKLRMLLEGQR